MLESERRPFIYEITIADMFEEYMRERFAQVGEHFSTIMRDRSVNSTEVMQKFMEARGKEEDVPTIMRFHSSLALLRGLWSYSVKHRFDEWGAIGVRKNWIVVTYAPPKNVHA